MTEKKGEMENMESQLSKMTFNDQNPSLGSSAIEISSPKASTQFAAAASQNATDRSIIEIDHPEGHAIRQQVEFYFSDENLPNDKHLRTLCRGTKNKPVSLGQILGWKKMRHFKPRSLVVEALKKSEFLEIIDNKLIRRRRPWDGSWKAPGDDKDPTPIYREPWVDEDFPSDEEGDRREKRLCACISADEADFEHDELVPPPGYKYDKRGALVQISPHSAKKPTGLEEYFAEPPMTASEALETEETFGEEVGIVNRLEIAIQRYFHNRKLDQNSRRCIEAFLRFGGVSVSPKPFARLDRLHIEELDVVDKKAALATHHIMPDKFDNKAWRIDFLHCAKGFLSSYFPNHFAQKVDDPEKWIMSACKIMINFYNYLLYHKVCPEKDLQDDIMQSRALAAAIAPAELAIVLRIPHLLPGRWNKAVARVWDFNYADDTIPPEDRESSMELDEAKGIVIDGFKSCPSHTLDDFNNAHFLEAPDCWHKRVRVLFKGEAFVEIVSIKSVKTNDSKLVSVGVAICKPWWNPGNDSHDVPEAHKYRPAYLDHLTEPLELWVDNIGLSKLMPEMKLEGKVMHLDFGGMGKIWVIGGNVKAYCSFYTVTLNDLEARQALKAPHLEKIEVHDPKEASGNTPPLEWEIPEPQPYSV